MSKHKDELRRLLKEKAVVRGEVVLSSGEKSDYYIDCRRVTLDAKGAFLVGEVLSEMLGDADAVGGLTLGADPIATAVALKSYEKGRKPVAAFLVRKGLKEHGMMKRLEGPIDAGSNVVIVDDVITKGGSILDAIEAAESEGHKVIKVICLVDRLQGGSELVRQHGYNLEVLFTPADLEI